MKSPNWKEEELLLALELYLSKSLEWLSKMTDSTEEIIGLSETLNCLDFYSDNKPQNFRSTGSIRMKLSNFKSLDSRYGSSSLSNISSLDKTIWIEYSDQYDLLRNRCMTIVEAHLLDNPPQIVKEYISRYRAADSVHFLEKEFDIFVNDMIIQVESFQARMKHLEVSPNISNICNELYSLLAPVARKEQIEQPQRAKVKEHGGINRVPIHSLGKQTKIGIYVQNSVQELVESKLITTLLLEKLTDAKWSKEVLHIGYPFFKRINNMESLKSQMKDANGHSRYWKTVYSVCGDDYIVCKEWYESSRKYFDNWLDSIKNEHKIEIPSEVFSRLLRYIADNDRKKLNIKRSELLQILEPLHNKDEIIDRLLELGVLIGFQGTVQELVVEDYDLLYSMINNPEKYTM